MTSLHRSVKVIVRSASTVFIEGPSATWLVLNASTPHIKQVSFYAVVLLLCSLIDTVQNLMFCTGDWVVELMAGYLFNCTFVVSFLLLGRLIIKRVVALERGFLLSFFSFGLTNTAICLCIVGLVSYFLLPVAFVLVFVYVFLFPMFSWFS